MTNNYFYDYDKDKPHPWMPATGTEGRCELCGKYDLADIHSEYERYDHDHE